MRKLVKYTFIGINLIFVLLYVAALLAAVVPSDKFVWFSYFGLAFPIFIVANFFFVLFWLFNRKWWFLISAILLIFSCKQVNQVFTLVTNRGESAENDQKITLLTYNISLFGGEKEFENIIKLINESNADIVCLQEFGFYNNSQKLNQEKILAKLDARYPYRHLWYKTQRHRFWWGVATFSKFPIVNKQKVNYRSAYNVSVYSDIVIAGDTVRVFNNHLESNKLTSSDMREYRALTENFNHADLKNVTETMSQKLGSAYRARAKQAKIIAQEVEKTPYPTIVCGDFNDVAQSYAYHTLAKGMTDAITSTSCGYNHTFYNNALFVNIDHILLDKKAFAPLDSHIEKVDFSDHYPVLATFGIKHVSSIP